MGGEPMTLVQRWKPSRELDCLRSAFDDMLERFGLERDRLSGLPFEREFFGEREPRALRPAIESFVQDGKSVMRADSAGIDPKDAEIKVLAGVLTIKGRREDKRESKKSDFFRREIRYGSFERSISLPEGIKAEDLKATYRDRVFKLTAQMPKEAAPKQVKIQIGALKADAEKKNEAA